MCTEALVLDRNERVLKIHRYLIVFNEYAVLRAVKAFIFKFDSLADAI